MRELREQLRKREQLEGELEAMRNQVFFYDHDDFLKMVTMNYDFYFDDHE